MKICYSNWNSILNPSPLRAQPLSPPPMHASWKKRGQLCDSVADFFGTQLVCSIKNPCRNIWQMIYQCLSLIDIALKMHIFYTRSTETRSGVRTSLVRTLTIHASHLQTFHETHMGVWRNLTQARLKWLTEGLATSRSGTSHEKHWGSERVLYRNVSQNSQEQWMRLFRRVSRYLLGIWECFLHAHLTRLTEVWKHLIQVRLTRFTGCSEHLLQARLMRLTVGTKTSYSITFYPHWVFGIISFWYVSQRLIGCLEASHSGTSHDDTGTFHETQ